MITLNKNNGIERLKNWSDVLERPAFRSDVSPKGNTVKSILGVYKFKDQIKCGLSSCHQPHNNGYLVQFESGVETNIGKDCGSSIFGTSFESMYKQFDQDLKNKEGREILSSYQCKIPEYEETLNLLLHSPYGAAWANKQISKLQSKSNIPIKIYSYLAKQAKNPNGILTESYVASENEIEDIEVIERRKIKERPYYLEREIGHISSTNVLSQENNLREVLINGTQQTLRALDSANVDTMLPNRIRALNKGAAKIIPQFENSISILKLAVDFLNPSNLEKLSYLAEDRDEIKQFDLFLKDIKKYYTSNKYEKHSESITIPA